MAAVVMTHEQQALKVLSSVIPILDVDNIVGDLTEQLQGMGSGALYCPRVAPTQGVVSCTYEQF